MQIWAEPFTELRVPKIFNLRIDPFERADQTSNTYWDWMLDHAYLLVPGQAFVFSIMQTMVEFPPRQKPASFSLEQVARQAPAGLAQRMTARGDAGPGMRQDVLEGRSVMGSDEHYPEEAPTHRSGSTPSRSSRCR